MKRRRSTFTARERGDASPLDIILWFALALLVSIVVAGILATVAIGNLR